MQLLLKEFLTHTQNLDKDFYTWR